MRKLFFLLVLLSNHAFSQSYNLYELTLRSLKNTEEFREFTVGRTDQIQVMPEVIPFYSIGFGFFDELQKNTGTDYSNRNNTGEIVEQEELAELSERRNSKLKLWFSKIENNVIMAELAYAGSKSDYYYEGITNFGQSMVFFARYENGKLIELKVHKRHNN